MKPADQCPVLSLRRAVVVLTSAVLAIGCFRTAAAVIIIDDFDDPALVEEIDGVAVSEGVDDLQAQRGVSFAASHAAQGASGRLDVGNEQPGIANATLTSAGILPLNGEVSAAFHFRYQLFFGGFRKTFDLTQGGLNDALIVDFLSLTGETMPRIARARMLSPNGGPLHESTVFDFREREEPFRLVFPFESFVPRRGLVNVPPIDFERIETVEVAFGSHFLETRGQVEQWQMKLDRIWVGPASAIPEPRGIVIAFVVVACCASWLFRCFLRRKRSCSL